MGKEAAFPLLIILRICCFAAASAFLNKSAADESSLLSIKASISSEILAANWSKETSFCTWTGVICGMKHPERVTAINLSYLGLEGTIAREIGNLSFLRLVDISHNSFTALIPAEIGNLRRLRVLKMAFNQLSGVIPQSLGLLRKLKMFDLSHNSLRGTVPAGFANWSQLQHLSLSRNYLTGAFPASIGNLSNLEVFDVSENIFYGTVVSEMGHLSNMRILNLQANNLSGEVPQAIFNLSMLEFLSLRENSLSGTLPFSIDKGIPNIQQLFIGNIRQRLDPLANQFHGKIPNSISNLSRLITLDLSDNSFTYVPLNLGSLHQLEMLNLEANRLMNNLSNPGQDFLSSLAACKNLKALKISFNPITGGLPNSLGSSNLSESLETLKALSCRLLYPIPNEIGNLSNLLWLNVGYNHFTGAIPTTLGQLRRLRFLEIHGNRFDGSISPVLCNLNDLYLLNLAVNNLSGEIPSCFGNLSSLREIDMSDNVFNANIASFLWFRNGVSNVKNLVALDLSENQLSGKIPSTISKFENLVRLSLARNKLIGSIGNSFANLKDLQHLDLCRNNLSGSIPKSLEALSHLNYFDVSFNELRGKIPDKGCFVNFTADFFVGNEGLCGPPRFNVKICRSVSKTKWSLFFSVMIAASVTGLILILAWSCCRRPSMPQDPASDYNRLPRITYREILAATGNLGEENLIARGGISSVYVGRFFDGVYAVKVFNLDAQDALESFNTETHMQSTVRHRNLLKIHLCCSQIDFKALVMTYMPNGDLEKWLYSANCSLNLFKRFGILKDVASALEYLHLSHSPSIVHCDLNPRNVLLDEEMVAHVGDFGIAKAITYGQEAMYCWNLGTIGYVAPERTLQGTISTEVDVYSYGILLMETLSRRKPIDNMFSGEFTMRSWMKESISDIVSEIVENELTNILIVADYSRFTVESWLKAAVALALQCSADSPRERPVMRHVVKRIALIHDNFKTTRDIILDEDNDPISDYKMQQVRSIREPFLFFQEFLRDFPEKGNCLEVRMRDAAYKAEDIIVSFMLQVPSHRRDVIAAKAKFNGRMTKIWKEAESIRKEVIAIKNSSAIIEDAVQLAASSSSSSSSPVKQIDYVVDLHEDSKAIKSRLCGEPSSLQVIPIVGMGGIGKTTLAKLVYDEVILMQHFDIHAWVTVTQDYSADKILSCLLASVEKFHKENSERSNEPPVDVKLFRILKKRRYLIVLDDIWNVEAWDNVRNILPDDCNGSRIVLTTRLTDVASYPDPCTPLHEMRLMGDDQSWNLLRKKVFDDEDCPPELEGIGKAVSRSCKGLPLAVVVVAGLLSVVRKDPNSWSGIAKNVISVAIEGQFEKILLLSYTHLPHHLRSCFLYMGMFPEDCEFRVSKLIKLWEAEGFLTSSHEGGAEECLKNLVKRSLVLVTKRKSDGGIKSCSLHDLMRELCIRKAHEERFLVNFRSRYLINSVSANSRDNQHCPRVSISPWSLSRLSNIYGLSTHSIFYSGQLPVESLLRKFRLLRVLDAGEAYLTSLPDELFELVYLVYLAIYYLGKIPPLLSKLENLQTLILHSRNEWRLFRAQASCLPQEIWFLPKLRHLVFYGRLPDPERRWPSVLGNLQTLSMVSQDMCTERILVMIPNLKKLEIHCSGGHQAEIFMKHLVHLRQLENLKLRSYFSYHVWDRDNITFPRTLRKLTLSRVPLPWDDMTIVGSLPNLGVLKLTHQSCKGNMWETIDGEFPQLEFLLLEKSELEYWITESSHFPMLKCLVLDECWQLTEIPEGIGEIPTLELIEVKGKASKSVVESAKRILEEQREYGNNDLQVRCMTHR